MQKSLLQKTLMQKIHITKNVDVIFSMKDLPDAWITEPA